jgi:hypothetical protein
MITARNNNDAQVNNCIEHSRDVEIEFEELVGSENYLPTARRMVPAKRKGAARQLLPQFFQYNNIFPP